MRNTLQTALAVLAVAGTAQAAEPPPPFDRREAAAALSAVDVSGCWSPGRTHVTATFIQTGAVSEAVVDGGDWVGKPEAECYVDLVKQVRVKPFSGPKVRVGKSYSR